MFIDDGAKVNTHDYVDFLKENLLSCVKASFVGGYVFTQDGIASHASSITQQWRKTHLKGFWDQDTCGSPTQVHISVYGTLSSGLFWRRMCAAPHSSTTSLKLAIETAWST